MSKSAEEKTAPVNGHTEHAETVAPEQPAAAADEGKDSNEFAVKAATVGVIVVGAALIETALIPGMIVGGAAVLAPKYLPKLTAALQPAFKSAIRGTYKFGKKARHAFAEAKEQVSDIVAEADAEHTAPQP